MQPCNRISCSPEDHITTVPLRMLEKVLINLNSGQIFIRSFHELESMRSSGSTNTHKLKWASTRMKSFPASKLKAHGKSRWSIINKLSKNKLSKNTNVLARNVSSILKVSMKITKMPSKKMFSDKKRIESS